MVVRSVENGKNKQKYVVKMGWEEKGKKNKNKAYLKETESRISFFFTFYVSDSNPRRDDRFIA